MYFYAMCCVLRHTDHKYGKFLIFQRQVLIYPVIHIFNFRAPSYQYYYERYRGTGLLNPRMLTRWFLMYLGLEPTKQLVNAVIRNQHIPQYILFCVVNRVIFGNILSQWKNE